MVLTRHVQLGRKGHSYFNGRVKLMLTVQVKGGGSQHSAPQQKTKTSKATRQTRLDTSKLPPSTNVSSPPARKRRGKGKAVASRDGDSDDEVFGRYENGYTKDDFVVPDDYDSFDDDFQEMERSRLKQKRLKDSLGPPIARDAEMSSLDDVHQAIVAAFEQEAGPIVERLRNAHSLRKPIFTTQHLRAMATRWTMTLGDMGAIPGIDQDKVEKFGKKIIPKIKEYYHRYEEIMGKNVPKAVAPPPPRPPLAFAPDNYMDLVSTDDEEEMEDAGAEEEEEFDFDDDGEESRFFDGPAQPPPDVQRWHEEFAQASKTPATSSRARSSSSTRGSSKFSRGGYRRRKSSGNSQRGRSGVSKKKATTSKRSSTGSTRSGSNLYSGPAASTSTSRSARGSAAGGSRGGSGAAQRQRIDMMEY
jgi:bloom syndrome protein